MKVSWRSSWSGTKRVFRRSPEFTWRPSGLLQPAVNGLGGHVHPPGGGRDVAPLFFEHQVHVVGTGIPESRGFERIGLRTCIRIQIEDGQGKKGELGQGESASEEGHESAKVLERFILHESSMAEFLILVKLWDLAVCFELRPKPKKKGKAAFLGDDKGWGTPFFFNLAHWRASFLDRDQKKGALRPPGWVSSHRRHSGRRSWRRHRSA